ncbi:hypothetical protein NM208_g2190 [Fusarium decemcellulare]|uniref:Uncharacterized protein n=1 Tax=Fusarium decemcellulare TaxID=57161 RepID=A0ACC1STL2_9HYPO|nr:hypothetical protein NM208_g2190 [Fusarium decemcellulare]
MNDSRLGNPVRIVQMYSMEVHERIPPESAAYRLSSALVEDRPNLQSLADPWSTFFRPASLEESRQHAITAVIASESEKLRETWVKFQESSDPVDRLDLDVVDPTMEGITKLVSQGIQSWNDKRQEGRQGIVSKKFHKFCNSVDSHKSLMKVLPESHEYFSLFMGSVTAVVQASVNHETIVENFAKALDDITTLIEDCKRDLTLFPHEEMVSLVVDLYTCIFQFLRRCLEWLMRPRHKRAADSFNEKLAELLQKDILEVKEKADRIRLHATQSGLADGRITRHHVEDMNKEIRRLREDNERMTSRVDEMKDSCQQLAQLIRNKLLLPQATDFVNDQRLSVEAHQRRVSWYSRPSSILSIEDVTNESSIHSENMLEKSYQTLDMSFDKQRVKLTAEGFHASEASPRMLQSLVDWLEDETEPSTFIWLQGPTSWAEDHENPTSMLAAKFIEMAGEIKLSSGNSMPLISYFCSTSRRSPREGNPTREAEGVIALIYALLRQLLAELYSSSSREPEMQASLSQLEYQTSNLDGTMRTWNEALSALSGAVSIVPMGMLTVIDGLHWLDGREAEESLRGLVKCLRRGNLRVMFTTSGRSGVLLEELTPEERVEVEEDD